MHRRPSREILLSAILGIAAAAVLLGVSGLEETARVVGAIVAVGAAKEWSGYWAARDRFEAWRKRFKR